MATIFVDGKPHEVDGADNLLRACLSLGLDVPYFCWHPALGSVGACRACAVKQYANADDKRGRIVMSCMTPSTDNTYISIDDEEAKAFRKSVVEWLMTNHPHDCPVCEEGGHCHLQDMTVMAGHNQRRYRFTKRTHQNQDLGPFINHEMNRCIACYRCVRYYKDYSGGEDLGVYGAHDNLYFGRETDGVFESEFSGNLIEVCPTGVFTDRTHSERYNRKWDMQFAPSVCQQCSVGCNISPGERYGELRRIENRYHGEINHYFLCDRGRFGHGYVNRDDRPRQPWQKTTDGKNIMGVDDVLDAAANALRDCKRIIGIGSPRASIEANFALQQWLGAENFFSGTSAAKQALVEQALLILQHSPVRTPSLREIESCDAIVVLGEDVTQTAPRIALALRQSVKNKGLAMAADSKIADWQAAGVKDIAQDEKSPLFIASFAATRLDDVAEATYRAASDDIARLGFAVANKIDSNAPAVGGLTAEQEALASRIAAALLASKNPLVVSGTGCASMPIMQASANIASALHAKGHKASISLCQPEVNSIGVAMLGGASVEAALALLESGEADGVVVVENDISRRADAERVDAALAKARVLVVIDHQNTPTVAKADFVLPAGSFAESDGTVINMEGRAQRYFQVYDPAYYNPDYKINESWRWIYALHTSMERRMACWTQFDEITQLCAQTVPALARIMDAAPSASYRMKGLKIARAPRRYSGRTAMRANLSVHEPRVSQDADSALSFSMEGYSGTHEDASFVSFAWAPGWNSPQAWTKFQDEVGGHLRSGDSGVRLIEPVEGSAFHYYSAIPAAFAVQDGKWNVVPLYHLFGSDELSVLAPAVKTMVTGAYVALATVDAAKLNAAENSLVKVTLGNRSYSLRVKISSSLTPGLVGLPAGIPGMPPILGHTHAQLSVGGGV
ncbi:MAG TPA: NADH-quinone oxidoreductase subunit NuoG [Pseudomonadales bacterium]|nr:NADH-quinone oxidoreductase subunit NuoG [Pseudomonadales bacterium]